MGGSGIKSYTRKGGCGEMICSGTGEGYRKGVSGKKNGEHELL